MHDNHFSYKNCYQHNKMNDKICKSSRKLYKKSKNMHIKRDKKTRTRFI